MIVWDKEKVKSAVALQCLECQHCSYFWQITGYFCKDFKNPLLLETFAPCHRPAVIISPVFMLIWFVTNYTTGKITPQAKIVHALNWNLTNIIFIFFPFSKHQQYWNIWFFFISRQIFDFFVCLLWIKVLPWCITKILSFFHWYKCQITILLLWLNVQLHAIRAYL